jgi:hypothetical protein
VTDDRLGFTLTPGYAMASGWTTVAELLMLATNATGARSIRHDAKGSCLRCDYNVPVYQYDV